MDYFSTLGIIIGAIAAWYTYKGYKLLKSPKPDLLSVIEDKDSDKIQDITISNPAEVLYLLLLLDQFPNGLWGASLEFDAGFYGHSNDPGSISVSTNTCIGMATSTSSFTIAAIQQFRQYLLSRQSFKGAFGMLRSSGTGKYPEQKILEHSRHTATALRFFLYFDGPEHDCVRRALTYLISKETRTPSGLWVDYGDPIENRVDPITVSFVLGALDEVRAELFKSPEIAQHYFITIEKLDDIIHTCFKYLFTTTLRTDNGYWYYRYNTDEDKRLIMKNIYVYTADVLSYIARPSKRLNLYVTEVEDIINKLLNVCNYHQRSLPKSPQSNIPNLDASASLIYAMRSIGYKEQEQKELFKILLEQCKEPAVIEDSTASGWSAMLLLSDSNYGYPLRLSHISISRLNDIAHNIISMTSDKIVLPTIIGAQETYIRGIIKRIKGVLPK